MDLEIEKLPVAHREVRPQRRPLSTSYPAHTCSDSLVTIVHWQPYVRKLTRVSEFEYVLNAVVPSHALSVSANLSSMKGSVTIGRSKPRMIPMLYLFGVPTKVEYATPHKTWY